MNRPRTFTIAAILMLAFSIIAIAVEVPNLMLGLAVESQYGQYDGPPFALVLLNFAFGVLGFPASYGVWKMQKWGVVLTIVLCAFNILTSLPAILFAPPSMKITAVIALIWAMLIILLLLRPQVRVGRVPSQGQ